ncbi:MCP four helix bundle domain-containing protein [Cyclobacterium plantarum]|uniref:Chemotaxis methyl-accepting receptor HlyB-like 4HB MCP domain-containing protein n=1 Tax=Cyclobacterium plantarum TaxID=2716263 RepID=A0ABX0HD12_9BACT|nr:MCP four helix bundle domain-containing protein [Cyclobacterium plantarum]NHE57860.1 hypothetical protein [Cyclobacterium plantarum]
MIKWAYSIRNKGKLSLLLMVIVGVVLLNHFKERSNAEKMSKAMTAMYQDRLMVEGYIYDISRAFSEISKQYQESITENPQYLNQKIEYIDNRIELFQKTQLTVAEEQHLRHLAERVEKIKQSPSGRLLVSEMEKHIMLSLAELQTLSHIQMEEGKAIISQTERIIHSGERLAQLEIVALLLILVLVQTLIISTKSFNLGHKLPFKLN